MIFFNFSYKWFYLLPFISSNQTLLIIQISIPIVISLLTYGTFFYILSPLFKRRDNSISLLLLEVSQTPVVTVITLISLYFSFQQLSNSVINNLIIGDWIERALIAAIIIISTYWLAQLFTQVLVHYLRDYARQTEAVWDNVLVPILERLLPASIYILGLFLFLEILGIDLTGIWVAFGGLTFVLGFALRDILANFFSGLVLLIDTPFQFGDVIEIPDKSLAVIKNIGLRVTKLYLIESDSEIYIPNASLVSKDIINLSRPTPHVAKIIEIDLKVGIDQDSATKILKETVLGHPDTLGNIEEKLKHLENFQGLKEADTESIAKTEAGKIRLLAEQKLNNQLKLIERKFKYLIRAIQILEKGGLNESQIKIVQKNYQEIIDLIGLKAAINEQGEIKLSTLEEKSDDLEESLISLFRKWYKSWLQDPDLRIEDERNLEEECTTKITILKNKINRLFQRIAKPGSYQTRLDDYALKVMEWLQNEFKASTTLWKQPTIRLSNLNSETIHFTIKFYIDHIKLEHWERSDRVTSEVRQEMLRRLSVND
ncbi:MAG: mechanosensitive ion channel domain-containing protein [Cyanobacteria bacterium P01_A01_bin.45]